jgi:hypothetical protein
MAPTPFLLGERSDGVVARRDGSTSSGHSNCQQTGSYNWVDLVKVIVTAPLDIFQRLSQAGIDPATVVVTEALGMTITWGAEGQNRFNVALDSLRHVGCEVGPHGPGFGLIQPSPRGPSGLGWVFEYRLPPSP